MCVQAPAAKRNPRETIDTGGNNGFQKLRTIVTTQNCGLSLGDRSLSSFGVYVGGRRLKSGCLEKWPEVAVGEEVERKL